MERLRKIVMKKLMLLGSNEREAEQIVMMLSNDQIREIVGERLARAA